MNDAAEAAERAMLGAMLTSPRVIDEVVGVLGEVEPYRPHYATIYRTIVAQHRAGHPVDAVTITAKLLDAGHARLANAAELATLMESCPVVESAGQYARIVSEEASRRRVDELADQLANAAQVTDPERRARLVAGVRDQLDGAVHPGAHAGAVRRAASLDWPTFLTREPGPVDFIAGRLMVRGQQISLVGHGKAGKSLFGQEWMWRVAAGLPFLGDGPRAPLRVLYVDQENTEDDIQERLLSFGANAETLRNLTYLSFPAFRPLNTDDGAGDLLAAVEEHDPAIVLFDTISRMINGKENEADPWLDLYRRAIRPLKARKVSSVRLDHFGKDQSRGARGNSAKDQDVDAVWELAPTERGSDLLRLTRTHTRNGKGESELLIRRHGEQIGDRWKAAGTWHGVADESEAPSTEPDPAQQYRMSAQRVLGELAALPEGGLTVRQIGDLLAEGGIPLKARTIQDALKTLSEAGEVDEIEVHAGRATVWAVRRP